MLRSELKDETSSVRFRSSSEMFHNTGPQQTGPTAFILELEFINSQQKPIWESEAALWLIREKQINDTAKRQAIVCFLISKMYNPDIQLRDAKKGLRLHHVFQKYIKLQRFACLGSCFLYVCLLR